MPQSSVRIHDKAFWDERIEGGAELGVVNIAALEGLREFAGQEVSLDVIAIRLVTAIHNLTNKQHELAIAWGDPWRSVTDNLVELYLNAGYLALLLFGTANIQQDTEALEQALQAVGCPPVKLPAAN